MTGRRTPIFKHDCTACTYLGDAIDPATSVAADLYFCTQGGSLDTVIARLSSEGSDYLSGLGVPHPLLDVARRRAAERGLFSPAAVALPGSGTDTSERAAIIEALTTATDRAEVAQLVHRAITFGRTQASLEFGWDALSFLGGPHVDPKALLASRDATVRADALRHGTGV